MHGNAVGRGARQGERQMRKKCAPEGPVRTIVPVPVAFWHYRLPAKSFCDAAKFIVVFAVTTGFFRLRYGSLPASLSRSLPRMLPRGLPDPAVLGGKWGFL